MARRTACPKREPISVTGCWNWTTTSLSAQSAHRAWSQELPVHGLCRWRRGRRHRVHPHRDRQDERRRSRGMARMSAPATAGSQNQPHRRTHVVAVCEKMDNETKVAVALLSMIAAYAVCPITSKNTAKTQVKCCDWKKHPSKSQSKTRYKPQS